MNSEVIPFPTGQTNAQLYNHQRNLTAVLRRFFATLSEGGVDLTAIETAIADLETDVAAVQDVNASFETIISAETVLGSLAEVTARQETQLEANARATIAASVEAHRATTGIRSQVSVTDGQALVINSLMAGLGVSNANIEQVQLAAATGDTALATSILTNETTVAGNTASIAVVQSSVDGIATRYGVYLNAQNEVIGYIQLDGTPLGTAFTVAVDKFQVAKAGTSGGDAVPVFAISTVGGIAKIAFVGDMLADGTIAARMMAADSVAANSIQAGAIVAGKIAANAVTATEIAANAITSTKIAANAVTATHIAADSIDASHIAAGAITAAEIAVESLTADRIAINGLTGSVQQTAVDETYITRTSTVSNSFGDMGGMSITVTTGANEKVLLTFAGRSGGSAYAATVRFARDGAKVDPSPELAYPASTSSNLSVTAFDTPPAGTHTYTMQWKAPDIPIGATASNAYRYFALMRFLR